MKQIQSMMLLCSILIISIFSNGCEIYDCEASETEINALAEAFETSTTIDNCTAWIDKMKEYDDEGCSTESSGAGSFNCEEFVCTMQTINMLGYGISMAFSFDSTTYCTYYDSMGTAMQEMVNAGGCGAYTLDGVAITQAMVDDFTSNGCDWGDSTTVNSIIPGQGNLTKSDIKGSNELIQLEELLDQIPENYSSPIRKRLHRLFEN